TPKANIVNLTKAGLANARLHVESDFYSNRQFSKDNSDQVGRLIDRFELAGFDYLWQDHHFKVYELSYVEWGYLDVELLYVLYPKADADLVDGRSKVVDDLITAAAMHEHKIDHEIWVYDKGYWKKNRKLWKSVQACRWDQVILDEAMKASLVADVEGFFDRKEDYRSFGVPWKHSLWKSLDAQGNHSNNDDQRGIILHGLPGNGKTISVKALMHCLSQRSPEVPTLYVKSLGQDADQDDIRTIFDKARETAPCLLVLEDIDSLVSDKVKSFFLNEIDGLEGNDGVMMIGSTNYLDRLDAGIAKRPSRFDRKYHFALPALPERTRYCDFWRLKLAKTTSMQLRPEMLSAIAKITEGFSFAYLQEALVTGLLGLVYTQRSDSSSMERYDVLSTDIASNPIFQAIKKQVEILRKEMLDSRKSVEDANRNSVLNDPRSGSASTAGFGLGR
ncbi:MAG: hypothetical protein Q9204_007510, partial [Flavoplaca sp. TL-2023a]